LRSIDAVEELVHVVVALKPLGILRIVRWVQLAGLLQDLVESDASSAPTGGSAHRAAPPP